MITEKIEIFLDVAEYLCFTDVAKKRYTTQPTISRQISALEEEWGLQLFIRTNKGLRLTPEGVIMLGCCKKIKQQCESSIQVARQIELCKEENLRIGFLENIDIDNFFIDFLEAFSQKYSNVNISIYRHSFGELRTGLEKGKLDIIYTYNFDVKNIKTEVVANRLANIKCRFVISQKHHLFKKEELSFNDLVEEYFYIPEAMDAPGREDDLQMILKAHGISSVKICCVSNLDTVLFNVRMGKGVALLATCTKWINQENFRGLELVDTYGTIGLECVWRKDNLNPYLSIIANSQIHGAN